MTGFGLKLGEQVSRFGRHTPTKSFGGYAKDISKRRFISLITPTVRTNPSGAFRKFSSIRRNLTMQAFRFSVDGSHFENGAFQKR